MLKRIFIILICTISFSNLSMININVQAEQKSYNYKLPFRWNEVWNTNSNSQRDNYGVHQDRTGFSMDFYSPDNNSTEVLAPSSGVVMRGCSVGNATYLSFKSDYGDTFRFVHIRADTTGLNNTNDSRRVNQGDVLGRVLFKGIYDIPTCSLTTEDTHVHFSWTPNMCPINIEGYIFDCEGMSICYETYAVNCNRKFQNLKLLSTNGIDTSEARCNDLKNRDWKFGDLSDNVKYLQVCLRVNKLYENTSGYDGYFGEYTFNQLKKWKNLTNGPKWQPVSALNLGVNNGIVYHNNSDGQNIITRLNKNGEFAGNTTLPTTDTDWQIVSKSDFFNNGISQILWRNNKDGSNHIWQLDVNGKKIQSVILRKVNINDGWFVAGTGDFNNDQIADIVWRNAKTGDTHIWILDAQSNYSRSVIQVNVNEKEWSIADIKDVNNDQNSDILWRNKIDGSNHIWIMNKNAIRKESKILRPVPSNSDWNIVGIGDFDNDKFGDILWRNKITGDNHVWKLNSNQEYIKSYILPVVKEENNPNSIWKPLFMSDVNYDGVSDIIWRGKQNNQTHIWKLDKNAQKINPSIEFPLLEGSY
jgi:hypothetical protein